jgi:hypothetical protein
MTWPDTEHLEQAVAILLQLKVAQMFTSPP